MNEFTNAILISGALCFAPTKGGSSSAYNHYLEATAKQTQLDKMGKKLEKKYVPATVLWAGSYMLIAYKTVHDQQIKLAWSF